MEIFRELFEKAVRLCDGNPAATQVVVMMTAKGNWYWFTYGDSLDAGDEERFLEQLRQKDDVKIAKLVCMWSDRCIDLPHVRLRRRLIELCPENKFTEILLQGEQGLVPIALHTTMP